MAAAATTGSRDYCVINANYRAVPCHRGTLSVGANRRVLCVPSLPHSWQERHNEEKEEEEEEEEEREERRSSVKTERERQCCGLTYTRERDIMALLQSAYITRARARVFSPLRPVRNHRGASFSFSLCSAFSPSLSHSLRFSSSSSLSIVSAYVLAYTLSSVFLTEANSGMHDGPKVSLNTPPRESTPPRVYIRGGRRAGITRSHPVSGVVYLRYMKRNATVPHRKNFTLDSTLKTSH